MSERPRAHSDQSKARIGFALKRVWGKRLKWKQCQEKCYLQWAQSIAEEAKKGGFGQEELEWDSYEKLKAVILHEQLQWAANKAKAKELAAERAAKAKKEREERLARQRKEKERKEKARIESMRKAQMSVEMKSEKAFLRGLKLKARLTKIHDKSVAHLLASQGGMGNDIEPTIEKWDLEFIKRERMRKEVSLADQIRAVKKNKIDLISKKA